MYSYVQLRASPMTPFGIVLQCQRTSVSETHEHRFENAEQRTYLDLSVRL